ncbi:MAG: hypothetical protein OXU20_32275 [Myxococcales bacterium]|nr:hypothetical protein [Myxococcales bacterium]
MMNYRIRRSVSGLLAVLIAAALDAAGVSAQCTQDMDCSEGERCDLGLTLAACAAPPCPEPPPAACVPELLGEACDVDADCGQGLVCTRLVVAIDCPADDEECVPTVDDAPEGGGEGFCSRDGDDAALAATSGLAPTSASEAPQESQSTQANVEQGPVAGAGSTGAGADAVGSEAADSSGGCTVGTDPAEGAGQLAWFLLAAVGLRRSGRV